MLDGLLPAGHLNGAIVFAGGEFALHEDVCAFRQSRSDLRKALPIRNDIVPLGFVLRARERTISKSMATTKEESVQKASESASSANSVTLCCTP